MCAGEQHYGEEKKKDRIGEKLCAEDYECHRDSRQNARNETSERRDEGSQSGNQRASTGIENRLSRSCGSWRAAESALNTCKHQRIKRHAIGHGGQRRPKPVSFGERRAQHPIGEGVRLCEKRTVSSQQRKVAQTNNQREQKDRYQGMGARALPKQHLDELLSAYRKSQRLQGESNAWRVRSAIRALDPPVRQPTPVDRQGNAQHRAAS